MKPNDLRALVGNARPCRCKHKSWNDWCKHDEAHVRLVELGPTLARLAIAQHEALEPLVAYARKHQGTTVNERCTIVNGERALAMLEQLGKEE